MKSLLLEQYLRKLENNYCVSDSIMKWTTKRFLEKTIEIVRFTKGKFFRYDGEEWVR